MFVFVMWMEGENWTVEPLSTLLDIAVGQDTHPVRLPGILHVP